MIQEADVVLLQFIVARHFSGARSLNSTHLYQPRINMSNEKYIYSTIETGVVLIEDHKRPYFNETLSKTTQILFLTSFEFMTCAREMKSYSDQSVFSETFWAAGIRLQRVYLLISFNYAFIWL